MVSASTLGRCVEAVRDKVQQRPGDVLREDVGCTGSGIERLLQRYIEPLLVGPRPVPGEIEAFLNESINIDRPVLSGALTRMQQHVLDDRIGTLAVLYDLVEIAPQRVGQLFNLAARFMVDRYTVQGVLQFIDQLGGTPEKLLTKLSGFLISCAMPAVS